MGWRSLFLIAFLFGPVGNGFAAEVGKNDNIDALTSFQLGDYALKFEGASPRKPTDLDNPPALRNMQKDTFSPFVGLKFSTPLKGDFFKIGR